MVGVVDDEAILRVVVAEDEPIEEPVGGDRPAASGAHAPERQGTVEQVAGR